MPTYRRLLVHFEDLSPVNQMRIRSGMQRPQIHIAHQWFPGNDTRGLSAIQLERLTPGDYIVVDTPEHPYVMPGASWEENTELIHPDPQ